MLNKKVVTNKDSRFLCLTRIIIDAFCALFVFKIFNILNTSRCLNPWFPPIFKKKIFTSGELASLNGTKV